MTENEQLLSQMKNDREHHFKKVDYIKIQAASSMKIYMPFMYTYNSKL